MNGVSLILTIITFVMLSITLRIGYREEKFKTVLLVGFYVIGFLSVFASLGFMTYFTYSAFYLNQDLKSSRPERNWFVEQTLLCLELSSISVCKALVHKRWQQNYWDFGVFILNLPNIGNAQYVVANFIQNMIGVSMILEMGRLGIESSHLFGVKDSCFFCSGRKPEQKNNVLICITSLLVLLIVADVLVGSFYINQYEDLGDGEANH